MTVAPPLLKNGDRVGMVAPSRVIDRDQTKAAYEVLKNWGLEVVDGDALYNKHGYFAGADRERLSDLQRFITDKSISAIFCARGGYGMTRIVDQLDLNPLVTNPKWVIGFSDITALHLALHKIDIQSIHGLMPVQFGNDHVEDAIKSLYQFLFNGEGEITAKPHQFNRKGKTKGQLVGGNLSLVVESLGTPTEVETEGKILFLEEVDEYLYKIDRMFMQLQRAGKLASLAGLIIGDFSDMKDTQIKFGKEVHSLIINHVKDYSYPLAFGFPVGHEALNLALPVSRVVQLSVLDEGGSLTF